jgi:hypothetical protein
MGHKSGRCEASRLWPHAKLCAYLQIPHKRDACGSAAKNHKNMFFMLTLLNYNLLIINYLVN